MPGSENLRSPAEIRHRIGAAGSFSLSGVSGDIRLHGNDGDEIVVIARSEGGSDRPLPLAVRRAEGSLAVELDERGGGWLPGGRHHGVEFDVSVPRRARVDVTAVSSDIEAHDLRGEQSYRSVSGDLVVDGTGGRITATTVSGDVQLTAVEPVELSVTTTSGDVEAFAKIFQLVRVRTVSGDMDLHGGFAAGPQHNVESVSGDLAVETRSGLTVETKRGLDFARSNRAPSVVGDGRAQLRFRSLSGDIELSSGTDNPRDEPPSAPTAEPEQDELEILRALERGEIDVAEASRRLEGAGSHG